MGELSVLFRGFWTSESTLIHEDVVFHLLSPVLFGALRNPYWDCFAQISLRSSVPPNMLTGVTLALLGDLLRGVTDPNACSAASASFTVSGGGDSVGTGTPVSRIEQSCNHTHLHHLHFTTAHFMTKPTLYHDL